MKKTNTSKILDFYLKKNQLNVPLAADTMIEWIEQQSRNANAKSLVIGVSGGIDSALVAALASKTSMPVHAVKMPCHSNREHVARANEVIETFNLNEYHVDLEAAFNSIQLQIPHNLNAASPQRHQAAFGALRSCLRSPVLDFVGKIFDGIILGTGNKDEDYLIRYFQKRGDGCVDISPIADLHKSEVYTVAKFLGVPSSVLAAVPSADLWGADHEQTDEGELGFSYSYVEFASRLAKHWKVPARGEDLIAEFIEKDIAKLTPEIKEVILKIAKMEIGTRHKENPNIPICSLDACRKS